MFWHRTWDERSEGGHQIIPVSSLDSWSTSLLHTKLLYYTLKLWWSSSVHQCDLALLHTKAAQHKLHCSTVLSQHLTSNDNLHQMNLIFTTLHGEEGNIWCNPCSVFTTLRCTVILDNVLRCTLRQCWMLIDCTAQNVFGETECKIVESLMWLIVSGGGSSWHWCTDALYLTASLCVIS